VNLPGLAIEFFWQKNDITNSGIVLAREFGRLLVSGQLWKTISFGMQPTSANCGLTGKL
jgi:hypothetical protein